MPLLQITATALTGALTAGAAVVGLTAPPAAQPLQGDGLVVPCGAVWDRLPADLRDDIRALRDLAPTERPAAAREIRRDALAGEYGDRVQRFAEHADERRAAVWTRLPADLRRDVRAARQLPADERRAAFEGIRSAALDGSYGDRVQEVAERIQERRAACAGPDA